MCPVLIKFYLYPLSPAWLKLWAMASCGTVGRCGEGGYNRNIGNSERFLIHNNQKKFKIQMHNEPKLSTQCGQPALPRSHDTNERVLKYLAHSSDDHMLRTAVVFLVHKKISDLVGT